MSTKQKQITILFKGKRVVSLHRPESSFSATATATAPSNDDVKTKHSHIHSVEDVGKRPRDEHIHQHDEQPDLKRPRPAAPPSATAHQVVGSANDDVRTTKHLCKEQQPDLKKSTTYKVGEEVEVRSDEEGFKGAWYPATVSAALGGDRYVVKYRTLLTDDEEKLLREETRLKYIRPRRPRIRRERGLEVEDKVDAWFNDGWWEGHITERLPDRKWCVYFEAYNEEMAFSDSQLRLTLKWVNARWVRPSKSTNNTARPPTGTKIRVGN